MRSITTPDGVFTDAVNGFTKELVQTAEEVYTDWKTNKDKQIDILPGPTPEERIEKLEEEKAILAENVYNIATILETLIGGTEGGQTGTTTTTTTN